MFTVKTGLHIISCKSALHWKKVKGKVSQNFIHHLVQLEKQKTATNARDASGWADLGKSIKLETQTGFKAKFVI